jgi:hypothetical protein
MAGVLYRLGGLCASLVVGVELVVWVLAKTSTTSSPT